jgi:hypothetical protein
LVTRQAGCWTRPDLWFQCGAPRRNRTGDPILTMEPLGTAVRNAVSPGRARPSSPKLSVLLRQSYALTLAPCADRRWRKPSSRWRCQGIANSAYLPAPLIICPSLLGGGSAVHGVERGVGQEGHGGVACLQHRSGVNPVALAGPRMVEWFWVAIAVVNRVAEAHHRPHGVPQWGK